VEKILLLVTNYILLGIAAIVRMSVYGDFKLLWPVFAESKFGMIYIDYDNQTSHRVH